MEKAYVLSPESEELSNEQSNDDCWIEHVLDTDFSDVEELVVNNAGSERGFSAILNSVACNNLTAKSSNLDGGAKISRNDMLGAWGLMEIKSGGLDQKFCNATHVVDETQMCTTECAVDRRIGQLQEELIGSYLRHRRVKTIRPQVTDIVLRIWERSWRNGCNLNWRKVSLMTVFRSNQRNTITKKVTEQGNSIRSQ